jgi:biopolymer transport protein ExbD
MFNNAFETKRLSAQRQAPFKPAHHPEPQVMMDINTTPLIDVLLVLIIMLIITIPAQLHSVNLNMPVAPPPTKKVEPMVIQITIDDKNTVSWNGKAMKDSVDLETHFEGVSQQEPAPEIHIRAQAKSSYGSVVKVMAGAQRHGLKKIGVLGSEQFTK